MYEGSARTYDELEGLEVAGAVAEGDEADGVVEAAAPLEEGPAGAELLPEALDPEAEELEPLPTQVVVSTQQIQKNMSVTDQT